MPTNEQIADGLIKTLKPDGYSKSLAVIGPFRGAEQDTNVDNEENRVSRRPQHHGFPYHCLFESTASFVGDCCRSSLAAYSA